MPSSLRRGSEVSSISSKTARLVAPPANKKRRVRERVYGVIMDSTVDGKWEVQWAGGDVEAISPGSLKNEGEPSPETEDMVKIYIAQK